MLLVTQNCLTIWGQSPKIMPNLMWRFSTPYFPISINWDQWNTMWQLVAPSQVIITTFLTKYVTWRYHWLSVETWTAILIIDREVNKWHSFFIGLFVVLVTMFLIPDVYVIFSLMFAMACIIMCVIGGMVLLDVYLDIISMICLIMCVGFSKFKFSNIMRIGLISRHFFRCRLLRPYLS